MPSRRARGRGRGGEARRRGKGPSRHARTRPSARTYPVSAAATSTSDTSRVNAARRVSARFSSSCRCLVSSSQPASETRKGKTAAGGSDALRADRRTTEGVFVCLSLFPHRVSYERQSHENSFCTFPFFETSTLRGRRRIFRFHSHRIPPDGTCPARLHERRTRSPFQAQARRPSRSNAPLSNFYVRRLSALGCAQSPRTAPFQGYSEVSRPRRQVNRYVRPSPFPARERSPRSLRASRVLPRRRLSGGRASPRDSGASLVRRVGEKISPDVSHKKQSRDHAVSRLRPPASPPDAGLRVRAMAAEDKSRIGLCGLAVMGQVRLSPPHDAPFGSAERGHRAS